MPTFQRQSEVQISAWGLLPPSHMTELRPSAVRRSHTRLKLRMETSVPAPSQLQSGVKEWPDPITLTGGTATDTQPCNSSMLDGAAAADCRSTTLPIQFRAGMAVGSSVEAGACDIGCASCAGCWSNLQTDTVLHTHGNAQRMECSGRGGLRRRRRRRRLIRTGHDFKILMC